jgi:hypothetical protein
MPNTNDEEPLPKHGSKEQIKASLEAKTFHELLGTIETEEVDFKDQPYPLDSEHQKYCLIDDIASFANHIGGIIVIGCRTKRADVEGDYVSDIRPVPKATLNFQAYQSICNEYIYPHVKGLKFSFYECPSDPDKGIALIEVPPASTSDRPHLLTHVVNSDTQRRNSTRYGLVERTGASNSAYPVHSFHGLVRTGMSLSNFENAFLSIEQLLVAIQSKSELPSERQHPSVSPSTNSRGFLEDAKKLIEECDLANRPMLVLGASPTEKIKLTSIYDGQTPLAREFDNPPEIRPMGFSFKLSKPSEIVDGKIRRKWAPGYKATQISSSGRILVAVPADEDFLAWGYTPKVGKPILYRSYVLTEVTYLFAKYIKAIFSLVQPVPKELDLTVSLRNTFTDGIPPQLSVAYDHGQWPFPRLPPRSAPKSNILKSSRLPFDSSVERIAFEIRACLYRRFGYGDELIPYATLTQEGRITTEEEIMNPNRQR